VDNPLLYAKKLEKTYRAGATAVRALNGISLKIRRGEFVAVTGPSGSGKTTLMNILGCLERPDSGCYRFDGLEVGELSDRHLSRLRARAIGFVFQSYNLIPTLSAAENVELPLIYSTPPPAAAKRRVRQALAQVGLAERSRHKPAALSGGEMQRVAIARALAAGPELVLADEPTGNLDTQTGHDILDLFSKLNASGTTILLVTHDRRVAARAQRQLHLRDGRFA